MGRATCYTCSKGAVQSMSAALSGEESPYLCVFASHKRRELIKSVPQEVNGELMYGLVKHNRAPPR